MMYFDSSALVKRYLKEDGTEKVNSLIASQRLIATSKLAYPEILSTLTRKQREVEISRKDFKSVIAIFEKDWEKLFIVEFHDELLKTIKELLGKYSLKGADTLHLSSAIWLGRVTKTRVTFVASDATLLRAARSENLMIIDPVRGESSIHSV
jgi:predicted nucleic acid-binding protein